MMELKNNTEHHMEADQMIALSEAQKILEKAFKERVHSISLTPNNRARDRIWGIGFAFDFNYARRDK